MDSVKASSSILPPGTSAPPLHSTMFKLQPIHNLTPQFSDDGTSYKAYSKTFEAQAVPRGHRPDQPHDKKLAAHLAAEKTQRLLKERMEAISKSELSQNNARPSRARGRSHTSATTFPIVTPWFDLSGSTGLSVFWHK